MEERQNGRHADNVNGRTHSLYGKNIEQKLLKSENNSFHTESVQDVCESKRKCADVFMPNFNVTNIAEEATDMLLLQ